ncbi:hypothetical protein BGZ76_006957, partial [Entomortierella beljakovae]
MFVGNYVMRMCDALLKDMDHFSCPLGKSCTHAYPVSDIGGLIPGAPKISPSGEEIELRVVKAKNSYTIERFCEDKDKVLRLSVNDDIDILLNTF